MPTCIPKRTQFAPGAKSQRSETLKDEVLDVNYLQGLLGSVERGIKQEKMRVRELLENNSKLHSRMTALRRDGDELYKTLVELKRDLRNERQRTTRLRQHANMSSVPRPMGQNIGGFQTLRGNYWSPYSLHHGNEMYNSIPYGQAGYNYMDPRGFMNQAPPQHPMSYGNMSHFQRPTPTPQYYFPSQYIPQPGNSGCMGAPGPQQYSRWMGVPQYGY
ncbi:BgTH12-04935 [Blumeria graminis f. sp. triticale]|uniref:BgTH12-04935 n=1 Tax=Blumeria graminis f. sp. triticale TaxID=1689686 RepID=A0A9W4GEA0_BLUGR|nr:BgTH12-04935 [Blumeria graminis f. sp. triticale]